MTAFLFAWAVAATTCAVFLAISLRVMIDRSGRIVADVLSAAREKLDADGRAAFDLAVGTRWQER